MANSSLRSLVSGNGTITAMTNAGGGGTTPPGPTLLTFSVAQDFKIGTMIATKTTWAYNNCITIYSGVGNSGKNWLGYGYNAQFAAGGGFNCSDKSASRARGGTGTGSLPASCPVYLYLSMFDQAGHPDYYLYCDTLSPECGRHPYTRDQWTGRVQWTTSHGNPEAFI